MLVRLPYYTTKCRNRNPEACPRQENYVRAACLKNGFDDTPGKPALLLSFLHIETIVNALTQPWSRHGKTLCGLAYSCFHNLEAPNKCHHHFLADPTS